MSDAPKPRMLEIPPVETARWVTILVWLRWWSKEVLIWSWIGLAIYAAWKWPSVMTFDTDAVRAIAAACGGRNV